MDQYSIIELEHFRSVDYTDQYCTVQRHSTADCFAPVQYRRIDYSSAQCSAVDYSNQYSTNCVVLSRINNSDHCI